MLKLQSAKSAKQQAEGGAGGPAKRSPGELRVQKDISELTLETNVQVEHPDPDNLMKFVVNIVPREGFYEGAKMVFSVDISPNYPHEAPKVHW
jgi:ubiquitin-conjugating enzyme E2 M